MDFGTDANYAWHFRKIKEVMGSDRKSFGIGKRMELLQIQGFHCPACGDKMWGKPKELHIHHILPLCLGGSNENYNLVIICKNCHNHQHNNCRDAHLYRNNVWRFQKMKYDKFDECIFDFIPLRVIATKLFHHAHYRDFLPFAESERKIKFINGNRIS